MLYHSIALLLIILKTKCGFQDGVVDGIALTSVRSSLLLKWIRRTVRVSLAAKVDEYVDRLENERRTRELREREKLERIAREEREVREAQLGCCQMKATLAMLDTCRLFLGRFALEKWTNKQVGPMVLQASRTMFNKSKLAEF